MAEYRLVTEGTKCSACSTEFWSEGRLAAHLRSSPGCVSCLRRQGCTIAQIRPGFGSKKRRQAESTAYTLSVPQRCGQIPTTPEEADWGPELRYVYNDLCTLLFEADCAIAAQALEMQIRSTLRQRPLYPEEIMLLIDTVQTEIQELSADGSGDPWPMTTVPLLLDALASVKSGLWTAEDESSHSPPYHSLREFKSILRGFDWATRLRSLQPRDGTPSTLVSRVLPDWEADWRQSLHKLEVSAVANDVGLFLPPALRSTWQSLLQGCTVTIHAPKEFWQSMLAAPFLSCKPN